MLKILYAIKNWILIGRNKRAKAMKSKQVTPKENQYFAFISNELKTIIDGINSTNSLLLQTELDLQQKEYIDTLDAYSNKLKNLFENIVVCSKIESSNLETEPAYFSTKSLVEQVICTFKREVVSKNIYFNAQIDEKLSNIYIYGDSHRIYQIIYNLVSNAVKHTTKGGVKVIVTCKDMYRADCIISFEVKDTGIGISKDKNEKLSRYLEKADKCTLKEFGEMGVRLAISKYLVELMGGTIGFESKCGEEGNNFFFVVPLKICSGVEVE